jgi:cardiolipin synthase
VNTFNLRSLKKEFFAEPDHSTLKDEWLTVPNAITGLGILLTFFYVYQYIAELWVVLIPVTVILIALTDALDGFAARHLDQHSTVGKWLDPIRDKLLTFAVIGNIFHEAVRLDISGWFIVFALVVFLAEAIVLAEGAWRRLHGMVLRVHVLGKARQAINLTAAAGIIVQLYWHDFGVPFVALVGVMALASLTGLIVYTRRFVVAHRAT